MNSNGRHFFAQILVLPGFHARSAATTTRFVALSVVLACSTLGWVGSVAAAAPAESEAHEERQTELRRLNDSGGFPPIGTRFTYPQYKGHWTFGYRYISEISEGLGSGTSDVDGSTLLGNPYTAVQTRRVDQIHLVSVAYAPLDRLSFELSLPIVDRRMDFDTASGRVTASTSGIGDARFVFSVPFVRNGDQETHVSAGFTFPTGRIDRRGVIDDVSGVNVLPYRLQLGSGTWDAVWGIAYTGRKSRFGWGADINGVYRFGTNARGYRLGGVYEASGWLVGTVHEWCSITGRFGWSRWTNVKGEDPALDKQISPANDNKKQSWNRLEAGPGVEVYLPVLGGQRFAVEALFPFYQNLDGPQLKRDWSLTAGFQWLY